MLLCLPSDPQKQCSLWMPAPLQASTRTQPWPRLPSRLNASDPSARIKRGRGSSSTLATGQRPTAPDNLETLLTSPPLASIAPHLTLSLSFTSAFAPLQPLPSLTAYGLMNVWAAHGLDTGILLLRSPLSSPPFVHALDPSTSANAFRLRLFVS